MTQTIADIKERLAKANAQEFSVLERSFEADTRKGVIDALAVARRRFAAEKAEVLRIQEMYDFDAHCAEGRLLVGLDEVGRGPLAGPLAVGAVVLRQDFQIQGLNDSKKLSASVREVLAEEIKASALAWAVGFIEAAEIDSFGITRCLKTAFSRVLQEIEKAGHKPAIVLLDGNPLGFDERETNVIKGDSKSASIAAASIIAKVARDKFMEEAARDFPQYGFEKSKGYGSAEHIAAIKAHGLCPLHRKTFCTAFTQETLF